MNVDWKVWAPIVISIVALLKDKFLLPATIQIAAGDTIRVVITERNKIQIDATLINTRNRLGVINRLEGSLLSPDGQSHDYVWNVFYKLDQNSANMDRHPTSIPVLAKSAAAPGGPRRDTGDIAVGDSRARLPGRPGYASVDNRSGAVRWRALGDDRAARYSADPNGADRAMWRDSAR